MYRPEYDDQFSRMQELSDINTDRSQNADPEIKQVTMKSSNEFNLWMEKENRRIDIEIEEFKKYGKVRTYNPNR
jgi:hypothetical protein